jgi:hypothetical protein
MVSRNDFSLSLHVALLIWIFKLDHDLVHLGIGPPVISVEILLADSRVQVVYIAMSIKLMLEARQIQLG